MPQPPFHVLPKVQSTDKYRLVNLMDLLPEVEEGPTSLDEFVDALKRQGKLCLADELLENAPRVKKRIAVLAAEKSAALMREEITAGKKNIAARVEEEIAAHVEPAYAGRGEEKQIEPTPTRVPTQPTKGRRQTSTISSTMSSLMIINVGVK